MAMFRKKPVEVEAMQFTEDEKNRVYHWINTTYGFYGAAIADWDSNDKPIIRLVTSKREMKAWLNDWIVKENGEFQTCKPDVFAELYEAVT